MRRHDVLGHHGSVTNLETSDPEQSTPDTSTTDQSEPSQVEPDQVLAAFARACPGTEVNGLRPMNQGYTGQHWVVDTDEGDLLVRIPMRVRDPEHQRHLLVATRKAAEAGVPVARLRAFVPHDHELGGPMVVQEFGPGKSASDLFPTLSPEQRSSVGGELGELVAAMHRCAGPGFSNLLGRDRFPSLLDYARARLHESVGYAREIRLDRSWDDVIRRVDQRLTAAGEAQPVLVHRDLYLDNVLLREDQDGRVRVAALLDFEGARWSDQYEEFGKLDETVFEWWPDTKEPFLDAYARVHPLGPEQHQRIHAHVGLYNVVMAAHFQRWQPEIVPDYVHRIAQWCERDEGSADDLDPAANGRP